MQELFLRVRGRYIRVLIEDVRADDGAVPTLVCHEATFAEVLPTEVEPEGGGKYFPRFPRALRVELEIDAVPTPAELKIDVSHLPTGTVPFSLESFSAKAAEEVASGASAVTLTEENARAWGWQAVQA